MAEIKYEIIKKIGVLSTSASGWAKELNLVSWNDREPKYDLRDRSADWEKMGIPAKGQGRASPPKVIAGHRGVTPSPEELSALKELLNSLEL